MGSLILALFLFTIYFHVSQTTIQELYLKWKSKQLVNINILFISSILVFCIMNALAISILRSSAGSFVYLSGNYKIYPTLALLFIYLFSLNAFRIFSSCRYFIVCLSFLFWSFSIWNSYQDVSARKPMLSISYQKLMKREGGLGFTDEQQAKFGVVKAMKYFESKHMYHAD